MSDLLDPIEAEAEAETDALPAPTPLRRGPWTIKAMPEETRAAIIAEAKRYGIPYGDWLARAVPLAIREMRRLDRTPLVPTDPRSLVAVESRPEPQDLDLDQVARMVDLARQMSDLGLPPSRSVGAQFNRRFRAMLGGDVKRPEKVARMRKDA